jgi:hypothetical protein
MRKPFTLGKVIFLSLLIWGFASFLLSQTHQNTAPQPQQASGVSRYQVVYSPNARADTFMVDSQTGKTWQFVTFTDIEGDPHVWRPVVRFENEQEVQEWAGRQTFKKTAQPQ